MWPLAHDADLIDLLLDRGLHVAIVGGPKERALCSTLVGCVRERKCVYNCVYNVAGQLPLSQLPGLSTRCALFTGNDSGPKHVAAGLGVPTIGIHSGAVEPYEYEPSGG
jgi:ADP-heptose:LPS heptosyltransferase